jgi:hypothetical protein
VRDSASPSSVNHRKHAGTTGCREGSWLAVFK